MDSRARRDYLGSLAAGSGLALTGCLHATGRQRCDDGEQTTAGELPSEPTGSWPTYQYDAANTGYAPDIRGPAAGVETAWRYTFCSGIHGGAFLDDGMVIAGGRSFDAVDGTRLSHGWDDDSPRPVLTRGALVAALGDVVRARDLDTGEERWRQEVPSRPADGSTGGDSSLAVADGAVVVPAGHRIYCLAVADGSKRWTGDVDGTIYAVPAVGSGAVYALDRQGTLYALSLADGSKRWDRSVPGDVYRSAPAVIDGQVFLASMDERLHAIDTTDGSESWVTDLGFGVRAPVALADGTVVAAGRDGQLVAIQATSGTVLWQVDSGAHELGAPVVADDVVYVGASGGTEITAFDANDGATRWSFDTRRLTRGDVTYAGITESIAVGERSLFVATSPGEVYALTEPRPDGRGEPAGD